MGADGTAIVAYRPLGIVFGVMPWNFPLWQVLRAAVPIMASGNGFMLKHADNVQGCALALEDLVLASGAPAGAFAALNVTRDAIADIIGDPRIAAVTVTAGVTAGSAIAAEAGRHLKKSVLELGGSDPFIVLADADIEKAAEAAVQARFQNCGQVCIAAKRIIIERPIAALFIERFVNLVQALRVGDPRDEETDLGPMARIRLRTELHDQVSRSVDAGATLLLGGAVPDGQGSRTGGDQFLWSIPRCANAYRRTSHLHKSPPQAFAERTHCGSADNHSVPTQRAGNGISRSNRSRGCPRCVCSRRRWTMEAR